MPNSHSKPTAAIRTHGCKLNQADSEALARQFTEAGYQVVDWAQGSREADVLVLTTCTVTSVSDAKARQALRSAHRSNQNALIVVTGCYAERAAEQLCEVEGVSLVPLLNNPGGSVKPVALTQIPRPAYPRGKPPDTMGYSIRSTRYRYTEWRDFKTGVVTARELYDHDQDPLETANVAGRVEYGDAMVRLAGQLRDTLLGQE